MRLAEAYGLEPFVEVMHAPRWASSGPDATWRPDPGSFAAFATAAARRYSGGFAPPGSATPLPRVRYWQAWGEPNRDYFLMPQYEGGRIASALHYREMVRLFSLAVHGVHPANVVIAGALSPLARAGKPSPLAFMREMLCLTKRLRRTCDLRGSPVEADVWSHHAYTVGGPTRAARGADNVSLGDLGDLRRYLRGAKRLGHIRSRGALRFWVTEFGWDTKPPDPQAIPTTLHARWVSHALYQMWRNGVSLATWWLINDNPLSSSRYQSGLYDVSGRPKRSLTAFRFPVVAFRRPGGVYVWGRTPAGVRGRVTVQIKTAGTWRRLGSARARDGVFHRTLRTRARSGFVRVRFGRATSVPFSLVRVRDRVVEPFGCGGEVRCR